MGTPILLRVSNTGVGTVFQHLCASVSPGYDIAVLEGSASVRSAHVFRYLQYVLRQLLFLKVGSVSPLILFFFSHIELPILGFLPLPSNFIITLFLSEK